jgi:anti-anti-sigma regulatory factor
MGVRLDRKLGGCDLVLQGIVDVFEARELHALALAAVDAGGEVTVRMEKVERLDSSAIQILLALGQTLKAEGRSYRLEGMSSAIQESWRLLGLG